MGPEVDRRKELGGSLPVENVQALASKNLKVMYLPGISDLKSNSMKFPLTSLSVFR